MQYLQLTELLEVNLKHESDTRQATGHVGSHMVAELLKIGRHEITAISRHDSQSQPPEGVKVVRVDYSDEDALTSALRGQDFLIISLFSRTPPEVHTKICNAAGKAGIKWIMPNVYGMDIENETLMKESVYGPTSVKCVGDVKNSGANYVVMACSFWYEWSLSGGHGDVLDFYGIAIASRKAVFFDDGTQKINTSTLVQCGRALAALLNLPLTKESPDQPALEDWKNKPLYVSSFRVSQRDMLDSVHRALGTTDKDWTIDYEPAEKRVAEGLEGMKKGDFAGFARAMYTRVFYKNGDGDFGTKRRLANDILGLPKEDFDEVTKWVVDKIEKGESVYEINASDLKKLKQVPEV